MAITLWQKMRLIFRVWSRRQSEAAERRRRDFVRREASWSPPSSVEPADDPAIAGGPGSNLDLEGLQVAYLDESGLREHYLDLETGEVIEFFASEVEAKGTMDADPARFRRIPTRTTESDSADRRAFVDTIERRDHREMLLRSLAASDQNAEFRKVLASDRRLERAWYNFRNDRASAAVSAWLHEIRA